MNVLQDGQSLPPAAVAIAQRLTERDLIQAVSDCSMSVVCAQHCHNSDMVAACCQLCPVVGGETMTVLFAAHQIVTLVRQTDPSHN